jgi:homoserine kinase
VTIRVLAPASTANLGPGFDSAAAALELWNEVVVEQAVGDASVSVEGEGADEIAHDASHLSLRAFAVFAPVDRYHFSFTNRIPLERGLGSSAAAIALGLVAGATAAGREVQPADLLVAAGEFEGHFDNLAAALYGGVTVAWRRGGGPQAARIAGDMPLAPIIALPSARTNTHASRGALPESVTHEDAAATAGAAMLLGAAVASGSAALLREAFHDRLHEPYRMNGSSLLRQLRDGLPPGAAAVTLSGSGPSVVVWAEPDKVSTVVAQLERDLPPDTQVLPVRVAQEGARIA